LFLPAKEKVMKPQVFAGQQSAIKVGNVCRHNFMLPRKGD
jgi:hypothetical protein